MNAIAIHRESAVAIALPEPRCGDIEVRVAVASDLEFVDQLQKMHTKAVGWMPTKQLETYIQRGQVLIAEEVYSPSLSGRELGGGSSDIQDRADDVAHRTTHPPAPSLKGGGATRPVGYVIAQDKYLKREELGIVYQLNVLPMKQRGLIGATLLKEVFHRAAYGCKLFCCWCAQDLEASYFWESMGFIPLAFRTGSRKAGQKKEPRIHIFWQRRIREGDSETPYWFPSETQGGAVREARLVLPIPPGTHWSDAKPAILPGMEKVGQRQLESESDKQKKSRPKKQSKPVQVHRPGSLNAGGLRFGPPPEEVEAQKAEAAKRKAEKKPKQKNDPKLVAAARELRDRYIEQINEGMLLPPSACGKYDVSRELEHAPSVVKDGQSRLLDAA